MLTRYRWYRIQLPSSISDISSIITGQPLTKGTSFGFSRMEDTVGTSIYRFLWRTKVVVTLFDDDANPSYEEVASINHTDFVIITVDDITFLRIENPRRNIRDLLNALESIIGLGFTCKPLTFEKAKPSDMFKSIDSNKLIGLKVVGAVVDEDVVARMEFASKQGMIIKDMKLLDDLNYNVVSTVFELVCEGVRGQVSIASNGLIKVSGKLAPRLVHLIEQGLPKLM